MLFWKSAILFSFVIQTVLAMRRRSFLDGNNACTTAQDYAQLTTSKNCFYHSDSAMNGRELIQKYAKVLEEHKVITDDGYILTIFRILRTNPKGVVLLVPTMYTDTKILMVQGNESTPMILWNEGYDIWIYNTRGTLHSYGHVNLSSTDYEYWNFSFDELGRYDLPKVTELVKNKTSSKMFIYGSSMACTSSLIYASMLPEHAKDSVNAFMLAGPPVFFKHSLKPYKFVLDPLVPLLEDLAKEIPSILQLGNSIPAISTVALVVRFLFRIPFFMRICHWYLVLLFGFTWNEFDPVIVNTDSPWLIRDTSWKVSVHYLQLYRTKTRFQRYNHGPRENKRIYGTAVPPKYPLENITVPFVFIISDSDILTEQRDTEFLLEVLPAAAKKYKSVYISGMNHGDYTYGKHRKDKIVGNLLKFLEYARNK